MTPSSEYADHFTGEEITIAGCTSLCKKFKESNRITSGHIKNGELFRVMKLTVRRQKKIQDLVADGPVRSDGRGQACRENKEVLEGILWIVKAGAADGIEAGAKRRVSIVSATVSFGAGKKGVSTSQTGVFTG